MGFDYNKFLEARKKNFRDNTSAITSGLEALMTMGSGAVTEPLSGYAGLAGLPFGGVDQGVKNVDKIAQMGYQPRDPRALQMIGNAVSQPMEWLENKKQQMGEATLKATRSPTLASLAYTSPEILGSIGALATVGRPVARAGRVAPTQESPDVVDNSRRDFMRNAGLLTAGVAASRIPGSPIHLLDAPEVTTAARVTPVAGSVARAVMRVNPDVYYAASWLKRNPEFIQAALNDGWHSIGDALRNNPERIAKYNRMNDRGFGSSFARDEAFGYPDISDDTSVNDVMKAMDLIGNERDNLRINTGSTIFSYDKNPLQNMLSKRNVMMNNSDNYDYNDFESAWDEAFMRGLYNRQIDPNNLNLDIENYFSKFNDAYKKKHGKDVPKRVQDMQYDYENSDLKLSRIFGKISAVRGPATRAGLPVSPDDFTAIDLNDIYNPTGE